MGSVQQLSHLVPVDKIVPLLACHHHSDSVGKAELLQYLPAGLN